MPLLLILLLIANALVLTSCGGSARGAMERAHTFPTERTASIDTAPRCPAPDPCPPPPDHRVVGLPAGIDTVLWLRLDSLAQVLHDPTGGILGAAVLRTRDSALIWQRNPHLRILPASTMKVLTAAAALEDLGPEFRWKTTVWATAPIVNGVLKGNLVLEGGGDPTFGVEGLGMSPLVSALSRAGLKEVQGNLIALDTMVGRDLDVWPSGWTITNSRDGYGAPVAGLNWGQNRTSTRSIGEPRRLALTVFSKALAARKIKVRGTDTTLLVRGDALPPRQGWELVAKVQSPKLSEVLRICLVHSVNPYAEAAILAMGVRKPQGKYAPRDQGKRRYRQVLASLGVPSSVTADDGSGLSRYNLVTAHAMASLLRRDLAHLEGYRASDLMPRGGQGTLRHRFGRLPSPTWVSAKTGTLDGTSTLVGILRVPGRDTLAFAFLSTGFQGRASRIRGFQDRLLMSLAGLDPRSAPDSNLATDSTPDLDDLPVDSAPPVPPVLPESLALPPVSPAVVAPTPTSTTASDSSTTAPGSLRPLPPAVLPPAPALPPPLVPSPSDHTTSRPPRPSPRPPTPTVLPSPMSDSVSKAPRPAVAKDHTSNLPATRRPSEPAGPSPFLSPSPSLVPPVATQPPSPEVAPGLPARPDSSLSPQMDSLGSPPEPPPSIGDQDSRPSSTDSVTPDPARAPASGTDTFSSPLPTPPPASGSEVAQPASEAGTVDRASNAPAGIDSRSPLPPNFDSLRLLQTTPPASEMEPVRDPESPLVPSGTDPDKVTP